jgi:RHS repeat-associated protein
LNSALSAPTYLPTYDGNGNISEYLTTTGTTAAHYEYGPFGEAITPAVPGSRYADFKHRFSTKPLDGESGYYYYGYRSYDPLSGRWLSRDPIGERAGELLYAFCYNTDLNSSDYLGLDNKEACDKMLANELAKPRIKRLIATIEKYGKKNPRCKVPSFECACCKENEDSDTTNDRGGDYFAGKIRFCYNTKGWNVNYASGTVLHELIHAYDDCAGKLSSCKDLACSEVRASQSEGVYDRATVRARAKDSTSRHMQGACKGQDLDKVMDDAMASCYQEKPVSYPGDNNRPRIPAWPGYEPIGDP